ncbi:biotin--[acetyl-CoA-carboxylase] ligase [Sagittula sp. SSi028]|uniref:biotin--[acetyl-CoA-carboxylase] ligase n=1 Tax=Sagittula sp. SSi028 TaxID=3400636 RepID=UPI003AF665C9
MPWPETYARHVLVEVDSTNAEAARRMDGLAGPAWICALSQTAARGRRGRAWNSPAGNFAATLVMRPTEPPETVALRSFVAALALYDALSDLTGTEAGLALKWPNDVLLNGGKVAGILLEGLPHGGLAVGIGVNLIAAPDRAMLEARAVAPVSVLSETGVRIQPEKMLDALAQAWAIREEAFVTYGFAAIREAWLARAARIGDTITARTSREETIGVFETVDATGQLVLNTPSGRVHIAAADVFF